MGDIDPEVQAHFDELLEGLEPWQQDVIRRLMDAPADTRIVLIMPRRHSPPWWETGMSGEP